MRVILLQDIKNLGKKYDLKEVKDGYARNFLIAKGLARAATKKALKWLEAQKEIEIKKAEEELKNVQLLVNKIEGVEVIIPVKMGEKSELFESITPQRISERLKELGFEIKKNQINLPAPVKEIGEFPIKINFEHNLEAEIMLIVTKASH